MKTKFNLFNERTLEIIHDEYGSNPREWDNLGTIYSWHSRYSIGEVQLNKNDYHSAKDAINSNSDKNDIIIPLYIYDHSGITISTTPFNCRWDSGQVGFIKVSKEKIRNELNCKRITNNILKRVRSIIDSEIKQYDLYLRGENYYYQIIDKNGAIEDSLGGFIGSDLSQNGILENLSDNDRNTLKEYI